MSQISERKRGSGAGTLTLTRVRIAIVDSNAAFAGVISTEFLEALRVSMLAFKTAVVAELDSGLWVGPSTAQGSKVVILRGWGRRSRRRAEDR